MPELPEVETALRGLTPHLLGRQISGLKVRDRRLRLPVAEGLEAKLAGEVIGHLRRRGKYLLLELQDGVLLFHLGMSGSLRVLPASSPPGTHDHLDLILDNGQCLRMRDPRRFGLFLWTGDSPEEHPLLRNLGPEPFDEGFGGSYLYGRSRGRRLAIKAFIMDAKVVVGVGNIYASESLFLAGIRPDCPAGVLNEQRFDQLANAILTVLSDSINAGGTSLRDFVGEDGHPGYFARQLRVYGREDQPCLLCASPIQQVRIGQRSSFFCPECQGYGS
jgi:formamidopyrimidine-DNA glycosylase